MTLTPHPEFATHGILQVHYQYYYYLHCLQEEISPTIFQD